MKIEDFFRVFAESLKDFIRNPSIIASGFALFIFISLISFIGGRIAYSFQTTLSNTLWIAAFFVLLLAFGAFILGGIVGNYNKKTSNGYFLNASKFWFRNLLVLITFAILYFLIYLIFFLFTEAMIRISSIFPVSPDVIQLSLFLISFAYFTGVIIFFSFSSQMAVLKDSKFIDGIRASFKFVKKNYLPTLALNIIVFVLFWIFSRAPGKLSGFLSYVLLIPFYFALLTRFVLMNEKN